MGAAKDAMGGGEAPPHDPAEAEAAINAEADKAGAAGNSDLMAKLKSAATNKKIQGAFMDVKNNGVSAAMKYKDDAECVAASFVFFECSRRWPVDSFTTRAGSLASSRTSSCRRLVVGTRRRRTCVVARRTTEVRSTTRDCIWASAMTKYPSRRGEGVVAGEC